MCGCSPSRSSSIKRNVDGLTRRLTKLVVGNDPDAEEGLLLLLMFKFIDTLIYRVIYSTSSIEGEQQIVKRWDKVEVDVQAEA